MQHFQIFAGDLLREVGDNLVQNTIAIGIPVFHILHRRHTVNHLHGNLTVIFIGSNVLEILEGDVRVQRNAVLIFTGKAQVLTHQHNHIAARHVGIGNIVQIKSMTVKFLLQHDEHVRIVDVRRNQIDIELDEQGILPRLVADCKRGIDDIVANFN